MTGRPPRAFAHTPPRTAALASPRIPALRDAALLRVDQLAGGVEEQVALGRAVGAAKDADGVPVFPGALHAGVAAAVARGLALLVEEQHAEESVRAVEQV